MSSPDEAKLIPACPNFELNMCHAVARAIEEGSLLLPPRLTRHTIPARQSICREREFIDGVPIICQGWAASVMRLSDERRQILSFHLPGDLVSTALFFEPTSHCTIEAVTEI